CRRTTARLRTASRERQDRVGELMSVLRETAAAQMVIKTFSLEQRASVLFEQSLLALFRSAMRSARLTAVLASSTEMTFLGVGLVIMALGALLIMDDRMTIGELVA